MFGSLGLPEILFILVLALLVFGPRKLPEVGRTIGRALGEFRRATGDLKRSLDREMTLDATPAPRPPAEDSSPSSEPVAGEGEGGEAEARDDSPDRSE